MATTIDDATLTVTINEDVKLNGHQVGSRVTHSIPNVNEASRRVFTVPTYETEILALSSSAGAGTYVTANLQYVRLTNLDDTNFVRIVFLKGSGNRYDIKIPAKRSAIFTSTSISGSAAGATFGSFVDFTSMKATADSAEVDIELFVAST